MKFHTYKWDSTDSGRVEIVKQVEKNLQVNNKVVIIKKLERKSIYQAAGLSGWKTRKTS